MSENRYVVYMYLYVYENEEYAVYCVVNIHACLFLSLLVEWNIDQ